MRILWLLLMTLTLSLAGKELVLPAGTPIFDKPSAEARLLGVLPEDRRSDPAAEPVRSWIRQHPLARYADFYTVELPGMGRCYASPAIRMNRQDNSCYVAGEAPLAGKFLLPVSLGVLFFLCYRLCRFPKERKNAWNYIGIVLAVRIALLSYVLTMAGAIVCNPADEPGYFEVAQDLLQGKCKGPWTYPVGYGVLVMIPWILLTGAESYFDIAVGISWFSGFVLGPVALLLGFRILLALKIGVRTAFAAVLTWAVLPFFCHHIPDWRTETFASFIDWPSVTACFVFYMELIGSGFNGMSDMFSTVLVFGVLLLAVRTPAKMCFLILVSALFGAACLVRLNNVFFAPVLAFLLAERFLARAKTWEIFLQYFVAGCGAYLFTVGVQLAVNFYQFGDVWTFPYSLHALDRPAGDRPADGFSLAVLIKGSNLRYLLESNLYIISCGIAGLAFMGDRRLRAVLGLWALPVILFFCGYSHTFCDAVRFILSAYIPLLAAAAWILFRPWKENKRRLGLFLLVAAALIMLHNGVILAVLLALLLLRTVWDAVLYLVSLKNPAALQAREDSLL